MVAATKIGLLAFSTNTGLGYQTWSFYKHMKPYKTLIADISQYNHMQTHHDRYPDARIGKIPNRLDIDWLLDGIETLFVCETPLNYDLFKEARFRGVKIVLQHNPEFLDYFNRPTLPKPDILAAPSPWLNDAVAALDIAPVVDLPVPIDLDIGRREITECRTIFHIAGRQAAHDRNGTKLFIHAALKAKTFKYLIYAQTVDDETNRLIEKAKHEIDLEVIYDTPNPADMYTRGDVLVLPRKYGGLCLPMNEALTAGIPVIMPRIEPNNQLLPEDWLVRATKCGEFNARTVIDMYDAEVSKLVDKMLSFADNHTMKQANKKALELGDKLTWGHLKPLYERILA